MNERRLEPWLRGPLPSIPPLLQPVAHALVMVDENLRDEVSRLSHEQLWRRVGGAASVGFHILHLAGSTDRLLTYARGEGLSERQATALKRERTIDAEQPVLDELLRAWETALEAALLQLQTLPADAADLTQARFVGRARLPSTVIGLVFHAAEHASRHAGQIATTSRVLTNSGAG